jgi:hypothetical protein
MTNFDLKLSASGLGHIAASKSENDFSFVVGDERYDCPWFIANFVSRKVARLHEVDPSVRELSVETEDREHEFGTFLSLGRGIGVRVSESNRLFLLSLARELESFELYFAIQDHLTDNHSISAFCADFRSSGSFDLVSDRAVDFLASHFFEIPSFHCCYAHFITRLPSSVE